MESCALREKAPRLEEGKRCTRGKRVGGKDVNSYQRLLLYCCFVTGVDLTFGEEELDLDWPKFSNREFLGWAFVSVRCFLDGKR